jgi:Binding-protein-dependent transport system inner membrane component
MGILSPGLRPRVLSGRRYGPRCRRRFTTLTVSHKAVRTDFRLPNNLPAAVRTFIGRDEEIADIVRTLTTSRLLTLTGAPGRRRELPGEPTHDVHDVALPGALPMIIAGLRLGMGSALLVIVPAEFVGAKSGIGYLIWTSWQVFQVEEMYVGLIVVAVFGYTTAIVLRQLEHSLIP